MDNERTPQENTHQGTFLYNYDEFSITLVVKDNELYISGPDLALPLGYEWPKLRTTMWMWDRSSNTPFDKRRDAPVFVLEGDVRYETFLSPRGLRFLCFEVDQSGRRQALWSWYEACKGELSRKGELSPPPTPLPPLEESPPLLKRYLVEKESFVGVEIIELTEALKYVSKRQLVYKILKGMNSGEYTKGEDFTLLNEDEIESLGLDLEPYTLSSLDKGVCLVSLSLARNLTEARSLRGDFTLPEQRDLLKDLNKEEEPTNLKQDPEPEPEVKEEKPVLKNTSTPPEGIVVDDSPTLTANKPKEKVHLDNTTLTSAVRDVMGENFGVVDRILPVEPGKEVVAMFREDFDKLFGVVVAVVSDATDFLEVPDVDNLEPIQAIHAISGALAQAPEVMKNLQATRQQWLNRAQEIQTRIERLEKLQEEGVRSMTNLLTQSV